MQHNPEQFMNDSDPDYDMDYGYEEELPSPVEDEFGLTKEEQEVLKKAQEKLQAQDPIMAALAEWKDGPSEDQLEVFRQQTGGDVYFIDLGEKEKYLFRPLRRLEWRTLLKQIEQLDESKQSEMIAAKGVLFPNISGPQMGSLPAGSVDTLKEMILRASNFMTPEYAVQLVRKL